MYSILTWLLTGPLEGHILHDYTAAPIDEMARLQNQNKPLTTALSHFHDGKQRELYYIKIMSILSIAASLIALRWPLLPWDHYWLAPGCWYSSMLLAVFSFILAMQQTAVISAMTGRSGSNAEAEGKARKLLPLFVDTVDKKDHVEPYDENEKKSVGNDEAEKASNAIPPLQCEASKKMVFLWHCPLMLIALSVKVFVFGIVPPLIAAWLEITTYIDNTLLGIILQVMNRVALVIFIWCFVAMYRVVASTR